MIEQLKTSAIIDAELSKITPEMVEAEGAKLKEQKGDVVGVIKSDLTRKLFTFWQVCRKRIILEEAFGEARYDPEEKKKHKLNEARFVSYGTVAQALFYSEAKAELDCYGVEALGLSKGWAIVSMCDCPACQVERGEGLEGEALGFALPAEFVTVVNGALSGALRRMAERRRQEAEEKKEPEKGAGVN